MTSLAVLDLILYQDESLISFTFSRISCRLLNSAVIPLQCTSLFREHLKAANSHLLHEYSSGYCTICAVYLVKSWYNSWTVIFHCSIVLKLSDACLHINVFKTHVCNPSITASRDQFLIS